jgi:putative transposase
MESVILSAYKIALPRIVLLIVRGQVLRRRGGTETIVTDRLASHRVALTTLGAVGKPETGRWLNNRAENSHQPFRRRERAMLRFRRMRSLQTFAALRGPIHDHFNSERTLVNGQTSKDRRTTALAEWWHLCAA